MENQSAGVTPQTAQAAAPSVPATQPASSLPTQDISERSRGANTPAQIRALSRELLNPQPQPTPAPPTPTGTDPETPPAAEVAPTETAPEATPEPETQAPAPESGEVETPEAKNLRLHLPETDKVGRTAAAYQRRNPDWTLKECIAAAEKQLGINPSPAPAAEPAKPQNGLPTTVEAVDAAIDNLIKERTAARVALDFENAEKVELAIRQLDRHRVKIERDAEQQQAQEVTRYNQQFDRAEVQAGELYEFARNPDSEGAKRMREIEQELKATGSPLYDSPDKPLKLAHMVAAEMNIAPRRKGAPPAPAKPAAAPAPKKQVLPGGSTVPPAAQQQESARIAKIQSAVTPHAIRNLNKEILAGKL